MAEVLKEVKTFSPDRQYFEDLKQNAVRINKNNELKEPYQRVGTHLKNILA